MAKDVDHERTYAAIYPLTSSVHHLDVVGLVAQSDGEDVEVLPSTNNLPLALSNAGWGLFVALDAFNDLAALGMAQEIESRLEIPTASSPVSRKNSVLADGIREWHFPPRLIPRAV
jgi:hypothetical protein